MNKTEKFINKANLIHNDKYDYSKTTYMHCQQFVTVICPIHGDFQILPNCHLSAKRGCQKCSKRYRPS